MVFLLLWSGVTLDLGREDLGVGIIPG